MSEKEKELTADEIIAEHRKLQASRVGAPPVSDSEISQSKPDISEEMNPHDAAPKSKDPVAPKKAIEGGPHQPSRNEDLVDSAGNPKTEHPASESDQESHEPVTEAPLVGPRGANVSPEHLTEKQKAESAAKQLEREQRGMSSTAAVDSRGESKHVHAHEVQGHDKHGARIPDKKLDTIVEEAPKHIGPRGKGAPKDTFHKK